MWTKRQGTNTWMQTAGLVCLRGALSAFGGLMCFGCSSLPQFPKKKVEKEKVPQRATRGRSYTLLMTKRHSAVSQDRSLANSDGADCRACDREVSTSRTTSGEALPSSSYVSVPAVPIAKAGLVPV